MHTNLVVLAGGASSRMKMAGPGVGLTSEEIQQANTRSKGLISIDSSGRPLLDYLLLNAKRAGYRNIFLVTGANNALFKEYFGSKNSGNSFNSLNISYAVQHIPEGRQKPLGTCDAVFQAMEQFPQLKKVAFTVCNSDNLYSENALRLLRESSAANALVSYDREALLFSSERINRFALMRFSSEGYLEEIMEKPEASQAENYRDGLGKFRVSMNIFKFNGAMFYPFAKECPMHPVRLEKELPTALMNMVKKYPKAVLGIPLAEHVPDLTSKEDIETLKAYLQKNNLKLDW